MCLKINFHANECCRGRQVWIYFALQPTQLPPTSWTQQVALEKPEDLATTRGLTTTQSVKIYYMVPEAKTKPVWQHLFAFSSKSLYSPLSTPRNLTRPRTAHHRPQLKYEKVFFLHLDSSLFLILMVLFLEVSCVLSMHCELYSGLGAALGICSVFGAQEVAKRSL